ncbi:Fungal specific transcription factor domain-containing protein [Cladophialophora immunda]|nr:Fungal specific transcription factor domain-containing protein [Cladophialophora immunda]
MSTSRRAAVACDFCRYRKRRCDGKRPSCGICDRRGRECSYPEPEWHRPNLRKHHVTQDERLASIQDLVREQRDMLAQLQQRSNQASFKLPALSSNPSQVPGLLRSINSCGPESPASPSQFSFGEEGTGQQFRTFEADAEPPPWTIPLGHQTSTSSLLKVAELQKLLGEYPAEFFYRVESRRSGGGFFGESRVDISKMPDIDTASVRRLINQFLDTVHSIYPIFEVEAFQQFCDKRIITGLQFDIESAILLVSMALGDLRSRAPAPSTAVHGHELGSQCFQIAVSIFMSAWVSSHADNLSLCQGLVLCAIYLATSVRPLEAWKLIHMASTTVQQIRLNSETIAPESPHAEEVTRISWACFLIECDILAEFHLPRSGIDIVVDNMLLPSCGDSTTSANLFFLAELSVRSLLNRIFHFVYSRGDSISSSTNKAVSSQPVKPDASFKRICAELDRQLEIWYKSLPSQISPDLSRGSKAVDQACVLQLRYWSAKHLIFRPFVLYAATLSPSEHVSEELKDKCLLCVQSCRSFLEYAGCLLSKRTAYTYYSSHFCLSSALISVLAFRCPALKDFVLDIDHLLDAAIDRLRPWACCGSSIECALDIVVSLRRKLTISAFDRL